MMIRIEKEYSIRVNKDRVWAALTDFSREMEYWGNIRDITVLRQDGNVVEREATVGPRPFGARTKQTITMEPKDTINILIEGESMNGKRVIRVVENNSGGTSVNVEWSMDIKQVPEFVHGIITGQLTKSTDKAMSMIEETGMVEK